jgi:O-antigen/teichoic acid export membrane protein
MSLSSQITLNTALSYVGRVISSVVALVIVGMVARVLGQEGFGGYTTIMAYLSMFVILADLGLGVLMTREISRSEDDVGNLVSNFFSLRLLGSLVFLLMGFLLSFLLPYSFAIQVGIAIACVGYFFLSVNQLLLGIFQKHLVVYISSLAEIIGRVLQLILVYMIYLGVRDGDVTTKLYFFLLAMSVASAVIFVIQYYYARRYVKIHLTINFVYWRNILKTTWPIALSIVLTLIYFKIDTVLLSFMKPQEDVGVYGVAYRVLESLVFFPAMFSGIILPLLSREAITDLSKFRAVLGKSLKVINIMAMGVVAGGVVLSYSIANFIGGQEFIVAGAPLQALFVATGFIFFGNILGRAVIALDLQKKAVAFYLFGVVLNIGLNLIFIPKYTYMGAAWTTVATEALITALLFYLVWKKAGITINLFSALKPALSAVVMAGVIYFLIPAIQSPLPFHIMGLYIALGGGIYFALLYVMKGFKFS